MNDLTVDLDYHLSGSANNASATPLALPVRVLDAEGDLVAESVASNTQPARFTVPAGLDTVFVRLTWPSGKTQTRRASFDAEGLASVTFTDAALARSEWSAWAVPRLSDATALSRHDAPATVTIGKYGSVWLKLWRFRDQTWQSVWMDPAAQYSDEVTKQLDFELDRGSYLLQLGGPTVPWRFVALPGHGRSRVLLTPNESTDPHADPLSVVVTSFRPDAEVLLEFLSRDALRSASSLVRYKPLATLLLTEKVRDPVAALAGAYTLLRTDGWRTTPLRWFENLDEAFPWLPDSAVVRCAATIRKGIGSSTVETAVRSKLVACFDRGLPLYAEALSLLREVVSVLQPGRQSRRFQEVSRTIRRLAVSSAWAGSAFSFYGSTPDAPSPEKVTGVPPVSVDAPRATVDIRGSFSFLSPTARDEQPEATAVGRPDLLHLRDIGMWTGAAIPVALTLAARALTSTDALRDFIFQPLPSV